MRVALRAEIGIAGEDDVVSFVTEDASLGGIRARGWLFVKPGEAVVVLILADERIIPTLARVVSSEVLAHEGRVELRLMFEHMSPARQARLADVLAAASPGGGDGRPPTP